MKKGYLIFTILLIMVIGYAATQVRINIEGKTKLSENIGDFKVYLANLKLNGTEIEGINDTKDGYVINVPSKGTLEYDIVNDSTEYDVETSVECEETNEQKTWTFDYTGGEQTFVAPASGTYKLETWGAQGGSISSYIGGYGGYSAGNIYLKNGEKVYINVGGKGSNTIYGGYNGGGNLRNEQQAFGSSGGGATHIATISGLLSTLENSKSNILIVSGGGGGADHRGEGYGDGNGGSGGGYIGNAGESINHTNGYGYGIGYGGTQTSGGISSWVSVTIVPDSGWLLDGQFGTAGVFFGANGPQSGGGGGFFGGGAGDHAGAGGGSGYIGNSLLTEKGMYCYNCEESSEESTKTISTTCVNEPPTENCAKIGNGYAKITSSPQRQTTQLTSTTIEAQDKINNKVEIENNGMKCNLKIKKLSRTEKKVYTGPTEWTFDYTGSEQTFTAPVTGTYKLETWGAQGGSSTSKKNITYIGGYGAYAVGLINLNKNKKLYVTVGGNDNKFNGGMGGQCYIGNSNGGDSTHISYKSGKVNSLYNDEIYILAAGGGGSYGYPTFSTDDYSGNGGNAGGITGNLGDRSGKCYWYASIAPTQNMAGKTTYCENITSSFDGGIKDIHNGKYGLGGDSSGYSGGGGGGGFYGGAFSHYAGGGGGSSYIGNPLLTEKSMYCYNCTESTEEETKTISTTCVNEEPTENCAKKGNGYARITLIKLN